MSNRPDPRAGPARFYDHAPHHPNDVPFYLAHLPSESARVLELGCGTGRVTIPLAASGAFVHGLDSSAAMLGLAEAKVAAAGLEERVRLDLADICAFDLGTRFDLIVAPFRVLQNLATDSQVEATLECVRAHLDPAGTCILNAFRPNRAPEVMRANWVEPEPDLAWEVETDEGRITCHSHNARLDPDPLVVYPRLIYRLWEGEVAVEEAVLDIAMRCYYPDELLARVVAAGFTVVQRWGGYAGEPYGEGPELVVQFGH